MRRRRDRRGGVLDQAAQPTGILVDVELARLDARDVQDPVDELEQVGAVAADRGRPLHALVAVGFALEQELRVAEHRGHRRADLVAHVGQELGLGAARGLGALLGRDQLAVLAPERRGVRFEPARHLVDRAPELADFVAPGDRHAGREVARARSLGRAEQRHRRHESAREHEARPERAHEREHAGDQQQLARAAQRRALRVEVRLDAQPRALGRAHREHERVAVHGLATAERHGRAAQLRPLGERPVVDPLERHQPPDHVLAAADRDARDRVQAVVVGDELRARHPRASMPSDASPHRDGAPVYVEEQHSLGAQVLPGPGVVGERRRILTRGSRAAAVPRSRGSAR